MKPPQVLWRGKEYALALEIKSKALKAIVPQVQLQLARWQVQKEMSPYKLAINTSKWVVMY